VPVLVGVGGYGVFLRRAPAQRVGAAAVRAGGLGGFWAPPERSTGADREVDARRELRCDRDPYLLILASSTRTLYA